MMPPTPQQSAMNTVLLQTLLTKLNHAGLTHEHPSNSGNLKRKGSYSMPLRMPGSRPPTSEYPSTTSLPVNTVNTSNVRPYPANLTPLLSALCPHVPARNRLVSWKPATKRTFEDTAGRPLTLPDEFVDRIQQVLANGYADSTLETYAAGLLAFHVFCDLRDIPKDQRAPCSSDLLNAWIATMAGHFAGASVRNYVHGLRAWHIIHSVEWNIDKASFDTIIHGAERLQPDRARRKK